MSNPRSEDGRPSRVYPPSVDWHRAIAPGRVEWILDEATQRFPDHPCCEFMGRVSTFEEIAGRVSGCAAGLAALGVGPATRVGLLMPNCPSFVIAYFAILKAGGAVVTLNPLQSASEIERQIRHSGTRIAIVLDAPPLLTKLEPLLVAGILDHLVIAELRDMLPWYKAMLQDAASFARGRSRKTVAKCTSFEDLCRSTINFSAPSSDPEAEAVLQYSGGTTGSPKAAILRHRNLHANATQLCRWFTQASPGEERLLAALPFFHAFGMTGVMNFGMALGGTLLLMPRFEPASLIRAFRAQRPTLFLAVPAMLKALANHPGFDGLEAGSLKVCVCGGDPLDGETRRRFEARLTVPLVEGYGLTECSPVVTCGSLEIPNKPCTAGLPLPGTVVDIVDIETRRPLSPREIGEIRVQGPQVMTGYFGAEESAAVFEDGMLRTADAGFLDEDGYLTVVDRLKDMVTVRGHHVYPRVVEDELVRHEAVLEAAVVGVPSAKEGAEVVAFCVPKPGMAIDEHALQAFLSRRLARHECPHHVRAIDSLPKSPLGKTLKHLLVERLGEIVP
jgi:long-chain acyl-CoA synthetase